MIVSTIRKKTVRVLANFVDLQDHAIDKESERIILDHFAAVKRRTKFKDKQEQCWLQNLDCTQFVSNESLMR